MVEQHALDASYLFPKTESARSSPLQCPPATTSAQDVVGDKLGVLGGDRDGRAVREGHNTVLVVRKPFIAVGRVASLRVALAHGDGIHGESFCVGSGAPPAVITRSSQKMLINVSYLQPRDSMPSQSVRSRWYHPIISGQQGKKEVIGVYTLSHLLWQVMQVQANGEARARDLVAVCVFQISLLACIYGL
jgi:hypothetical protein